MIELFKVRQIKHIQCTDHAREPGINFGFDFCQRFLKGFILADLVIKVNNGCKELVHLPRPAVAQRNHAFEFCLWCFHIAERTEAAQYIEELWRQRFAGIPNI